MKPFLFFDHGADIGVSVSGRNLPELLGNAALALAALLIEGGEIRRDIGKTVIVEDGIDTVVVFLNELVYLWDTERFLAAAVVSAEPAGGTRSCTVYGDYFDSRRHRPKKEVKAATYHGYSLSEQDGLLTATIIFDV